MAETLNRQLSRFVSALDYDALPADVVDKVKASLVHGLVTAFIGAKTDAGQRAIRMVLEEEPRADGATLLADGRKATRYGAGMANSMLMHTTNQGDSYRMLAHPGACVIPAALAAGELAHRSGRELITAIAAGYEVECRLAGDFIPSTQARGFRTSPVYGVMGAATAAGKLNNLDEQGMTSTLGWATSFAAGLVEGGHAFHEPAATRNGLLAGQVGLEAFAASERAFEAPAGFYHAFAGDSEGRLSYAFYGPRKVDLGYIVEDLGERWETRHIVMKIPPTPGFNCPIIELIKDMRRDHGIAPEQIEGMQIYMNWMETSYPSPAFTDAAPGKPPRSGGTPFVAAYTAIHGEYPMLGVRPNQTVTEGDDAVGRLQQRVEVLGVWDRVPFAPRITMHLQGGTSVTGEYRGDELEWDLATELKNLTPWFPQIDWPREKLDAIVETVSEIENHADLEVLIRHCIP